MVVSSFIYGEIVLLSNVYAPMDLIGKNHL